MPLDTFPSAFKIAFAQPTGTTEFRVLTAQFGNGYNQRTPDGVNNVIETWNIQSIPTSATDMATIVSFLSGKYGTTAFLWTPPGASSALKWICKNYSIQCSQIKDEYVISANLERVYDL